MREPNSSSTGIWSDFDRLAIPDVMLPGQYFARLQKSSVTPEQRLASAIFEEAVLYLQKVQKRGNFGLYHRAKEDFHCWLDGGKAIMSYQLCCELLDVNPVWLRKALLNWMSSLPRETTTRIRRQQVTT